MLYPSYDPATLSEDQRRANPETVKRVRAAVADIVENERRRQQAESLIHCCWDLEREELDRAAGALGIPPMSDEEWSAIKDRGLQRDRSDRPS
ncbi:hypothetical protein AB0B89_26900 [Sphaerisporangium sp. NPDC049002]|uniref:hypothetical protein n=1 Tax=Sphaerisporangium sp. NPDC049002 TaxID=3155392 RepID=UPI0033E2654B